MSDEVSGKIDRVCCGAVKIFMGNKSSPFCTFLQARVCVAMKAPVGLSSGRAVLRSKVEGLYPDKLGGIFDKGYHGLQRASRWFCKFYCSKAVIVGLIFNTRQETISVSHIVMFAEKTYNAFESVGHTKRGKERES
ncbi:UNVERIFIED_CONTAM: hypothetical protein NY603_03655 [Bacteroidetes bacterium 56_B9]